ncbi:MAG: DUF3479 domain-containing protein, partial [Chromatiales bacterium]
MRVVLITLDSHMTGAAERARRGLEREVPGLRLGMHAAAEWADDAAALERCRSDIAEGHLIIVTMLFMEEHFKAVLPALQARQPECDAMICCMSASEIMRLTRMGRFTMDGQRSGPIALLRRL